MIKKRALITSTLILMIGIIFYGLALLNIIGKNESSLRVQTHTDGEPEAG